jgi:threonylcarbamoyladenosine tRNA methylthiotransferase MtaB
MYSPKVISRRRRVAFANLGCRLNISESDAVAARFVAAGYDVRLFEALDFEALDFDAVVVNTCTVTAQADRKSRNLLRRAGRSAGHGPVVVATGCFATGSPEAAAAIPGVDYVVDNDRKAAVFDLVEAHLAGEVVVPEQLPADPFGYQAGVQPLHTRATLKIQDGCDNNCTFCIIPQVRGRAKSREANDVLAEARRLVDAGFHELVITGVNIGRYQWRGMAFVDLLGEILNLSGDYRIRLSSLEPDPLDQRFVELLGDARLCPHVHLCLQSGSDRTLLRMRREYDVATYRQLAAALAARVAASRDVPLHLTTDIMVGFPGETEEDFAQTLAICEELGFGHVHTFRYSPRQGTRAERMPAAIDSKVANGRSRRVRTRAAALQRAFRSRLVGAEQQVLIERIDAGIASGYGESYVPIRFDAGSQTRVGELDAVVVTAQAADAVLEAVRAPFPVGT